MFGCSAADIHAAAEEAARDGAHGNVADNMRARLPLELKVRAAVSLLLQRVGGRWVDVPAASSLFASWWPSDAIVVNNSADHHKDARVSATPASISRLDTAATLRQCRAHRGDIFAAECSPARWCDNTLWLSSPQHARSCVDELSEISAQYAADTSEAFNARWESLASSVLVEVLFVLTCTWMCFRVVGTCSSFAREASGNAQSTLLCVAAIVIAEKIVVPHLSVVCAHLAQDLQRTVGISNEECREWPRGVVSVAASVVASVWQVARARLGAGYAVLTIMALEVLAARLHAGLKRCAPRVFGDAKDNEISKLRLTEKALREENAKMRGMMLMSANGDGGGGEGQVGKETTESALEVKAVVPPELVVSKDNTMEEEEEEEENKTKKSLATQHQLKTKKAARRAKKWVGSSSTPNTPIRHSTTGAENAGVNGTPGAATPPVARRRKPRRALRPRSKLQ